MTTGKTIALTRQTFVYKVMSLLFNMLSIKKKKAETLLCKQSDLTKHLILTVLEEAANVQNLIQCSQ